jgi:hypothetical protein
VTLRGVSCELAEGDPIARDPYASYKQVNMPNLSLGKEEVAALLDSIDARSAEEKKELEELGSPRAHPCDAARGRRGSRACPD